MSGDNPEKLEEFREPHRRNMSLLVGGKKV